MQLLVTISSNPDNKVGKSVYLSYTLNIYHHV